MNIYTFKLTKKHIVALILAAAALVALLILLVPGRQAEAASGTVKVKTPADQLQFLSGLGYQAEPCEETKTVLIPKTFDKVYETYNGLQKDAGYDLLPYAGKKVELTTYRVGNYPGDDEVLLDLLVYKHKVIGGAVYTAAVDGFMYGLVPLDSVK